MNLDILQKQFSTIKLLRNDLKELVDKFNDIIIIGNGGSNAIASHICVDYTKFLHKRAISFSDAPRLTAYINDYGRDEAYKQFISEFATKETLIILISSSGNSNNVINAAKYCEKNNLKYKYIDENSSLDSFDLILGSGFYNILPDKIINTPTYGSFYIHESF